MVIADFGDDDALLAIATQDRALAFQVPSTAAGGNAKADEIRRDSITPALRHDDWSGAAIAAWTSPEIPSGGSIEIPVPQIETQVPALQTAVRAGGALQFNVALSGLSGYLQHVVDNQNVGVMVDMSPKCALTVVPAPAAALAKTAGLVLEK